MQNILLVFLGGGIGASCRYLITLQMARYAPHYPLGTLLVNLIACYLIGLLLGGLLATPAVSVLREPLRLLCVVGFLGGFSTLSSLNIELITMAQSGHAPLALLHFCGNIFITLLLTYLGVLTAHALA